MTEILAVVEGPEPDPRVLRLAGSVARVFSAKVRRLRVDTTGPAASRTVLEELAAESVGAVVLLARPGADAACWAVILEAAKPVVVVPPRAGALGGPISRVLLPLDGSPDTALAVADPARRLILAGTEVVAAHVFDKSTVPAFWDQLAHTQEAWTEEFLLRNLPVGVQLDLRRGRAPQEVLREAATSGADLILLGWSQRLNHERAPTVRLALEGVVPVMLVGAATERSAEVQGPSALHAPAPGG